MPAKLVSTIDSRLEKFPEVLRQLIAAELAAGNTILEMGGGFPAPPAGDCVKLAKAVSTRPRVSAGGLSFYDRNSSIYSGEWTDERRFYFVIEPPRPPPPEPDMHAIPAAANTPRHRPPGNPAPRGDVEKASTAARRAAASDSERNTPGSLVDRFRESMVCTYERWHDGIGYDLALLSAATPAERSEIEEIILSQGIGNWRDVEALAALQTPRAKRALKRAMDTGNAEIRSAVLQHAPYLVCEDDKTSHLLQALRIAEFFGGLTQALDLVETYHPPEVVAELLRGALERKGEVAVHFAAMLMFIHGKAKEAFDWEQRPFYLRFDADTRAQREAVFRELCTKIGVEADAFLKPK